MSFISYSMTYYTALLRELEHHTPTAERIYRAKQALKMLDDLLDEGYTELAAELERSAHGVTRLRSFLRENHAEPFAMPVGCVPQTLTYSTEPTELTEAVAAITEKARYSNTASNNPFLRELCSFTDWLGCEPDTAYIFLLRDTLLPYIRFASAGRAPCVPWLLGRSTLNILNGQENTDDLFRAPLIDALEQGCGSFDAFCSYVLPEIRKALRRFPKTESFLKKLLRELPQKRLIVVESGCYGTFPMLLKALDTRVELRMYTTVPYLAEIYKDRIFTRAYERNRLFETLCAQDQYIKLSDAADGRFYVTRCTNPTVEANALAEVKAIFQQKERDAS